MKYSKVLIYLGVLSKILLVLFILLDLKLMVAGSIASIGMVLCLYITSDSRDPLVQDLIVPGFIIKNRGSNFVYGKKYFESASYIKGMQRFWLSRSLNRVSGVNRVSDIQDITLKSKYNFFKSFASKYYKLTKKDYISQLKKYSRMVVGKMFNMKDYLRILLGDINQNSIYVNIK